MQRAETASAAMLKVVMKVFLSRGIGLNSLKEKELSKKMKKHKHMRH